MFYTAANEEWYQGDIVSSFPFVITDLNGESNSSFKLFTKPALVISQTCDLQRRPFVQVCPIHNFSYLRSKLVGDGKSEKGAESFIEAVKKRSGVSYYFYIPGDPEYDIEEGFADLGVVTTVRRSELITLERIATIEDYPRHILSFQMGNLFSRPH